MAYSAKKRWMTTGSGVALAVAGIVLGTWLVRDHLLEPALATLLIGTIGIVGTVITLRSYSYLDEVQRQTVQKHWFWGSMIGITATLPVVMALSVRQTHWLEAMVQFIFHHPGPPAPALYLCFGYMLPLMFQCMGTLVLKLLDKLPRGSQS